MRVSEFILASRLKEKSNDGCVMLLCMQRNKCPDSRCANSTQGSLRGACASRANTNEQHIAYRILPIERSQCAFARPLGALLFRRRLPASPQMANANLPFPQFSLIQAHCCSRCFRCCRTNSCLLACFDIRFEQKK